MRHPQNIPVSVIIPTLNEEKYLPLLLNSLADTNSPIEVIVVDGNSVDGTATVVEQLKFRFSNDSSLRLVKAPERGISKQRNLGAREANNDVLLFLDADIVIPSKIAFDTMMKRFVDGGCDVATTLLHPLGSDIRGSIIFFFGRVFQRVTLFFGEAYFAGSCILVKKSFFEQLDGFDEALSVGEDIDFSIRASTAGSCGIISVFLPVSMRRFKNTATGRCSHSGSRAYLADFLGSMQARGYTTILLANMENTRKSLAPVSKNCYFLGTALSSIG